MKRIFLLTALFFVGAVAFTMQAQDKPAHPFNISIKGGPLYSLSENEFSYRENGKTLDLITWQGDIALGYDFTNHFGARLSASYGKNVSACNTRQTSGHGFYPYDFSSVNVFADAILNLKPSGKFSPKLYAGLGGAYTFGFSDPRHPWQKVTDGNTVFGFRGGFIAQYDFTDHFGIFADLCGEAYTDNYNGLKPNTEDHDKVEGYAGFPLDLRGILSFGLVFHF